MANKTTLQLNGFKLIRFTTYDDPIFGNLTYNFIDNIKNRDKLYITVLIGANGTLKSRLFQRIIEIFWAIYELQIKSSNINSYGNSLFKLEFSFESNTFIICRDNLNSNLEGIPNKLGYNFSINNKPCNIDKIKFPQNIIASSIMITDKFPFPDQNRFPNYKYLGSRYRPQLASTKTYINRVVDFISQNVESTFFIDSLTLITKEFFNNSYLPCITYVTQNTHKFFSGKLQLNEFYSYFSAIEKKYKLSDKNPPFKLNHYRSKIRTNSGLSAEIVNFCNALVNQYLLTDIINSSKKYISYNLLNKNDINRLRKEFYLLEHMRQLGIVSPAEIEFLKESKGTIEGYSVIDSSSGEYNLLGTFIGLLASIEENSLIFIDEPEISLHPNWQMKFISFIRKLFSASEFGTCHLLIATHSNFLLSDLDGNNSSVIALSRDVKTKLIKANLLTNINTFGWSAEEVLYSVFNVRTVRNYYLETDLTKLLGLIGSGSKNTTEIRRLINRIELMPITKNDPLLDIINESKSYLNSND